jgi:hypothetical protein
MPYSREDFVRINSLREIYGLTPLSSEELENEEIPDRDDNDSLHVVFEQEPVEEVSWRTENNSPSSSFNFVTSEPREYFVHMSSEEVKAELPDRSMVSVMKKNTKLTGLTTFCKKFHKDYKGI